MTVSLQEQKGRETRARRRIRRAVEATGRTIDWIDWEPLRPGGEKAGMAGGWTVFATDGEHALGLNVSEVIESIGWWAS